MFPKINRFKNNIRMAKKRRDLSPALENAPNRKAVIYKITTMSPRKPNSAKRTFAKVRISISGRKAFAKIPGIGEHALQTHSEVFIRGHGPKDSPGVNYHLVRGVYDFNKPEPFVRKHRRSKFGLKNESKK